MKRKLSKNLIYSTLVGLVAIALFLYKISPSLPKDNKSIIDVTQEKKELSNISVISQVKIDENFYNSMDTKELIHYKILNSIDFFSSIEGELNIFNIVFGNSTVTYAIDAKNNKSHVTTKEIGKDLDFIYNNGKAIEVNNLEKNHRNIQCIYNEDALANINAQLNNVSEEDDITANVKNKDLNKLKPLQRYDFAGAFLSRNNDPLYDAGVSILSQGLLAYSLKDYNKWDIQGEETYLDRICIKMHGNLNIINKLTKSEKFTAWVDKETGVVLKYYEEDSAGKQTYGFDTAYVKYNNTLDENKFILDYNKYPEKVFPGK